MQKPEPSGPRKLEFEMAYWRGLRGKRRRNALSIGGRRITTTFSL